VDSKVQSQHFGENIHGNILKLYYADFFNQGYKICEKFIFNQIIIPHVDIAKLEGKVISYKSLVIEWCQKEKKQFLFEVFDDNGNDEIFGVRSKLIIR
jgi:ribonuclease-3